MILLDDNGDRAFQFEDRVYPIHLRPHPRSRSLKLRVDPVKRAILLTHPRRFPQRRAMAFLAEQAQWLEDQLAAIPVEQRIGAGSKLNFRGQNHLIQWRHDARRAPEKGDGMIIVGGPQDHVGRRIRDWLIKEARQLYAHDLSDYCERANVRVPQLSVGDARSRWGSCSSRGAIRLSWRLVMAPDHVRRAVVAHEVAHLVHMGHDARFYGLLDEIYEGDRRLADQWLRREGPGLHLIQF